MAFKPIASLPIGERAIVSTELRGGDVEGRFAERAETTGALMDEVLAHDRQYRRGDLPTEKVEWVSLKATTDGKTSGWRSQLTRLRNGILRIGSRSG